MNQTYTYNYPHPAVTVDVVVFGYNSKKLEILLIQRNQAPFINEWALPGGFVLENESLENAVARELKEETNLSCMYLEQLYTFGEPNRDPRERVISVAYFGIITAERYIIEANTDARNATWFPFEELPKLAFDHQLIVNKAIVRLKAKLHYEPIGFELLPEKFPFSDLEHLYKSILGNNLDRRNFRSKMLKMKILIELDEKQSDVPHKRGHLYSFDIHKYNEFKNNGFQFQI